MQKIKERLGDPDQCLGHRYIPDLRIEPEAEKKVGSDIQEQQERRKNYRLPDLTNTDKKQPGQRRFDCDRHEKRPAGEHTGEGIERILRPACTGDPRKHCAHEHEGAQGSRRQRLAAIHRPEYPESQ